MILKYRVHEVARDLDVKSKEISDLLLEKFKETKKHMTVLTEDELNFLFEYYTQKNSVENFREYFSQQRKASEVVKHKKKEIPKESVSTPSAVKPVIKKSPTFISKNEIKANLQKFDFVDAKPKPKVTAIERVLPKRAMQRRITDIRTSNVNIEQFNEKYDRIASERVRLDTNAARKQKIPVGPGRFNQRFRPRSGKKETEAERLKRIASERKAKPITVLIPDEITVSELATRLKATSAEVIKKLMEIDVMASVNDTIDFDIASLVAMEFHAKVEKEVFVTIEEQIIDTSEDKNDKLVERPPVVVVMGHVDHGKTSLLDSIRKENVTASELGGITQHIGAYRVKVKSSSITFIDTPGHEAFTTMRARGAKITDVAILVVAADDGVMPQTVEAINHAKAAKIPIIVAINKIDKEGANPERIKQQLAENNLVSEDWGGEVPFVEISAKSGENVSHLLDTVLLMAQMQELRANPDRAAKGVVIEAKIDKGRGAITSILVQNGTLKLGDTIIAGTSVGKVRTITDDKGQKVSQAGPSIPVEITGMDDTPNAGDTLNAVSDERLAKELVRERKDKEKEKRFTSQTKITIDNLFDQMEASDIKELKVIVKADVQGSAEAVKQSLSRLSDENVRVNVVHSAAGAISESDIMLASASNAMIIGFNVRGDSTAEKTAKINGVSIKFYTIIYDCIKGIEDMMKGMVKPKTKETIIGHAECRHLYKISGVGVIAGSYVLDGEIKRNAEVRILRDDVVIAQDKLASLKRFKEDAKEVSKGYECGIKLEHFGDIKKNDIFEAFVVEEES